MIRALQALVIASAAVLFASGASAASATYTWVPDAGYGGSGTIVLNDPNITDPANFGFPGAIVDDDSLVSLSFTFPASGVTLTLPDFNLQNVANDLAVGAAGWAAAAGQLTTTFQFTGSQAGIQSVRVSTGGGPSLNDLLSTSGAYEQQLGTWHLATPEPSSFALLATGLIGLWLSGDGMRRPRG